MNGRINAPGSPPSGQKPPVPTG